MKKINLQLLVILWWVGAGLALCSFFIPYYLLYILVGTIGWIIIIIMTLLIIYEMKIIKDEDKRKEIL